MGINEDISEQIALPTQAGSIITVVGVGGGGGNAVNYMWNMGIRNVSFLICNTDQKALDLSPIENKIRLGRTGLGAGNDPRKGRSSAIESLDEVRDTLLTLNTKMLFITAGMGGGTGTGAAPVIAKLAKEMDILTVAIVTSPLLLEGKDRYKQAMEGIKELKECVDSLLVINNENIQNLYIDDPGAMEAFGKANELLSCAAKGISEIITVESSYINVDFADVSKVMKDSGRAHMSVESASGKERAKIAAQQSLTSPLLDYNNIKGAKNILLSMATSEDKRLGYSEMKTILSYIQSNAQVLDENGDMDTANIIFGISTKPELGDNLEIVLVATGFENKDEEIEDFDAYYRTRLAASQDPSSPFIRMSNRAPRIPQSDMQPMIDMQSPIACGESVVLPEREPRYPNIETLLRTPAYIARKAKLMTTSEAASQQQQSQRRDESTDSSAESRLF